MTFEDPAALYDYLQQLQEHGYTVHHESWCAGYLPRTIAGKIQPYKGQFGKGYTVHLPCKSSTRYHVQIYYIKTTD